MSVRTTRILRGPDAATSPRIAFPEPTPNTRVVPRAIFDATAEAARIIEEAERAAAAMKERALAEAHASAERLRVDIRNEELAKLLATHVSIVHSPVPPEERIDELVGMAQLLAERLLGEELTVAPLKIRNLAQTVLAASGGHKEGVIWAHPADVAVLCALMWELGLTTITVEENAELRRGSIHLHTDVGDLDGRIETQLERFGAALKAVLQKENATAPSVR